MPRRGSVKGVCIRAFRLIISGIKKLTKLLPVIVCFIGGYIVVFGVFWWFLGVVGGVVAPRLGNPLLVKLLLQAGVQIVNFPSGFPLKLLLTPNRITLKDIHTHTQIRVVLPTEWSPLGTRRGALATISSGCRFWGLRTMGGTQEAQCGTSMWNSFGPHAEATKGPAEESQSTRNPPFSWANE